MLSLLLPLLLVLLSLALQVRECTPLLQRILSTLVFSVFLLPHCLCFSVYVVWRYRLYAVTVRVDDLHGFIVGIRVGLCK